MPPFPPPPPPTQSKINGTERTKKECQGEKKRRIRLQTKSDVISIKWLNIYSFRTKKSQVQQFCLPFAQNENAINLTRWSGAKRTQSSLNWRFDSKADMTRYESNTRASISESHPQTEAGKKGCARSHDCHIQMQNPVQMFLFSQLTK